MPKRKCAGCGDRFERDTMMIVGTQAFCSHQCKVDSAMRALKSLRAKREKKAAKESREAAKRDRVRHRSQKEALKTVPQLTKEAEAEVRRYVRARDKPKQLPCPSCLKPFDQVESEQGWKTGGAWDAGHYRSKGAAPQHRFNVLQIHLQCKSCNAGESKNRSKEITVQQQYRKTLIERIGLRLVESIENDNAPRKFTKDYLRRMRDIFRRRANRLERRHR